jgi:hypothetical protein
MARLLQGLALLMARSGIGATRTENGRAQPTR